MKTYRITINAVVVAKTQKKAERIETAMLDAAGTKLFSSASTVTEEATDE